jgi:cell division protein FtsI (penicillin-binding protein 3)
MARVALLAGFVLLAARAGHLSVFDERGRRLGERQTRTVLALAPERGAILDRSGHELALSVDAPSIYATPGSLSDPDAVTRQLAKALGRPRAEVAKRLSSRSSFVFVARWVSPEAAARVAALSLPGVGIVREPRRVYPTGELAAQLVGFANIDGKGVRGLEQAEDGWLRGSPRRLPAERDGSGDLLVDRGDEEWGTSGGDVALTLDAAMQADAVLGLRAAIDRTGARGGMVVTLDPRTGDVLALAEAPEFDPNRFRQTPYDATRARTFLDALEPGSTLKVFLVAAALENRTVAPEDGIDCENGSYQIPGKLIRDHHPYGVLTPADILRVSSNICSVKLAYALGPEAHVEMLRRFGFGAATGSGFPDESTGLLREQRRARPVDHATLAFGQGLSVTPIQLAAATGALANGGMWMRPRLVTARRESGGRWQPTRPEAVRRVISPETSSTVLGMMEKVTGPDGTGRLAALEGLRVAGKTGTAQKFDTELGRYSDERFVAWFIGVAPADDPRLVVVAALDEPERPLHTGGAAAAPLFARVAAAQLSRLGIVTQPAHAPGSAPPRRKPATPQTKPPRREPEVRTAARTATPPVSAAPKSAALKQGSAARPVAPAPPVATAPPVEIIHLQDRVLLPDLTGLTVAEVKAVTARARVAVEISGAGRVVSQEPPPGSVVASQSAIHVRFAPGADPS